MGESLYHLLGVDRDADDAAIRTAYRERVTDNHPDVSEDPDAADAFKRLTAARDVLLDDTARARYDRLGHDAYAAAELDGDHWQDAGRGAATAAESPSAPAGAQDRPSGRGDRSAGESTKEDVDDGGPGAGTATATGGRRHSGSTTRGYRPPDVSPAPRTAIDRFRRSLAALGPWVVVHLVFLVTAAGAAGVLSASTVSVPALSIPLGAGFFGLALFLSALHVVTILYV